MKQEYEMRFECGGEDLRLEWHEGDGMFHVTCGPARGKRCDIGTHCDLAVATLMFNWEAKAMQTKRKEA